MQWRGGLRSAAKGMSSAPMSLTLATRSSIRKWDRLDAGHFHPTEALANKISSVMRWVPACSCTSAVECDGTAIMLSRSTTQRGRSWRSGPWRFPFPDLHRTRFLRRSINRIAAWVIGTRNTVKALLIALLEPTANCGNWRRPVTTPSALRYWRRLRLSPSERFGMNTADDKMFLSEPSGWTTSSPTKLPVLSKRA